MGKVCPPGCLPVYSVGTEKEAKLLLAMTCPMNYDGNYYSPELAEKQSIANLTAFAKRLDEAHEILKKSKNCQCVPV